MVSGFGGKAGKGRKGAGELNNSVPFATEISTFEGALGASKRVVVELSCASAPSVSKRTP